MAMAIAISHHEACQFCRLTVFVDAAWVVAT